MISLTLQQLNRHSIIRTGHAGNDNVRQRKHIPDLQLTLINLVAVILKVTPSVKN